MMRSRRVQGPTSCRRAPLLRSSKKRSALIRTALWKQPRLLELIQLAHDLREAAQRGERLGLRDDELAFYDALASNESAIAELGDEALKKIARELVESVRNSVTIDWSIRESVRAGMRARIKRLLRKHGYPLDKTEGATQLVLEQAEFLSEHWPIWGDAVPKSVSAEDR
jgi:Domain of unknown function (DUF3387)